MVIGLDDAAAALAAAARGDPAESTALGGVAGSAAAGCPEGLCQSAGMTEFGCLPTGDASIAGVRYRPKQDSERRFAWWKGGLTASGK